MTGAAGDCLHLSDLVQLSSRLLLMLMRWLAMLLMLLWERRVGRGG